MIGTYPSPMQPLAAVIPGLAERPGGMPTIGQMHVLTIPLLLSADAKTAASKTYKQALWAAPTDGWYVVKAYYGAVVVPNYDSAVLALERYDASGDAGANLLSAANVNLETLTAKEATQMTLSTTQINRELDEGDVIWSTTTIGLTEVAAGEGLFVTLVLQGPEPDPA